jgi:alpha-glucosidase
MLALPGGAYVYQGEELGLPEVRDLPDELRQDPTFARTRGAQKGRDGCRVPIPWSGDAPPFGFGPDGAWLPQPADWAALTVEQQMGDPSSMLSLYRAALRIRREHPALGDGTMTWLPSSPSVLAFRREPGFVCAVNLDTDPAPRPEGTEGLPLLLASAPLPEDGTLPADTAVWFDDRRSP